MGTLTQYGLPLHLFVLSSNAKENLGPVSFHLFVMRQTR